MKIDRLETITLRFEYADGFQYAGDKYTARVTSLVLVHTDSGRVGVGAAYSHPGLVHLIVQEQLAPLLVGEDPSCCRSEPEPVQNQLDVNPCRIGVAIQFARIF